MNTVSHWVEWGEQQLQRAGVFFGHGTDNALDESAWLVLSALGIPVDGQFEDWDLQVTDQQEACIRHLMATRIEERKPVAYLTGEAWFCGLKFIVNDSVLVPRSPIAELIVDQYTPWVVPEKVNRVLDLCTGSGCIAIATALAFPEATVDASDISAEALQVAKENVALHQLENRVNLYQSDLFSGLPKKKYDLIVTNPPYVGMDEWRELPAEYLNEPQLGLTSGEDGLDAPLDILLNAADYLQADGVLICEVGYSEQRLQSILPAVPFCWISFEQGGSGVFCLSREELVAARPMVLAAMENKIDV